MGRFPDKVTVNTEVLLDIKKLVDGLDGHWITYRENFDLVNKVLRLFGLKEFSEDDFAEFKEYDQW